MKTLQHIYCANDTGSVVVSISGRNLAGLEVPGALIIGTQPEVDAKLIDHVPKWTVNTPAAKLEVLSFGDACRVSPVQPGSRLDCVVTCDFYMSRTVNPRIYERVIETAEISIAPADLAVGAGLFAAAGQSGVHSVIKIVAALCLMAALLTTGCTVTSYTSATGEKFSRWSLGSRASVGELAVGADTNGVRSLKIKGYSNDHVEAAAAITEAAVRGATQ